MVDSTLTSANGIMTMSSSAVGSVDYQSSTPTRDLYRSSTPTIDTYRSSTPSRDLYRSSTPTIDNYRSSTPTRDLYRSPMPTRDTYRPSTPTYGASSRYRSLTPTYRSSSAGSAPYRSSSTPATGSTYLTSTPIDSGYRSSAYTGSYWTSSPTGASYLSSTPIVTQRSAPSAGSSYRSSTPTHSGSTYRPSTPLFGQSSAIREPTIRDIKETMNRYKSESVLDSSFTSSVGSSLYDSSTRTNRYQYLAGIDSQTTGYATYGSYSSLGDVTYNNNSSLPTRDLSAYSKPISAAEIKARLEKERTKRRTHQY